MADILQVGQKAPDFRMLGMYRNRKSGFSLSDFLGERNVIMWFYVYDWTPL